MNAARFPPPFRDPTETHRRQNRSAPIPAPAGPGDPQFFDRPPPPRPASLEGKTEPGAVLPSAAAPAPFAGRSADFEQQYCVRFGIPPDRYLETVLRHTLYPHVRCLRRAILAFDSNFFAADCDFLAGVGRLWRRRDFASAVKDFYHHPANRGLFRRGLRLRVSARRTQALVNALLSDPVPDAGGLPRSSVPRAEPGA